VENTSSHSGADDSDVRVLLDGIFLYHGEDYFRPPTEFANSELPMTTGSVLVLRAANPITAGMFRPTITGLQETSVHY
jgi:hypothetical protein